MVHLHHSPLTNRINLLHGASVAAAALALTFTASQSNAQSLSAIQQTSISGTAGFNLQFGESFNVSAEEIQQTGTNTLKPFETTVGSSFGLGGGNTQGDDPSVVGNAGQSSLVLTYDRDGFLPIEELTGSVNPMTMQPETTNVVGNGSITAVAGITPFGGDALSGGVSLTNVPPNIRLNQDLNAGLPGIEFVTFASTTATTDTIQNGASIITTLTGADSIGATLVTQSSLVNALAVSVFE